MRKPGFGETNFGAAAGALVGSIGGLFALGLAAAIVERNAALLVATPLLAIFSLLVCGPLGWVIGGQIGPRFGDLFKRQWTEIAGGVLGGLIPVTLVALWGWYMVTPR